MSNLFGITTSALAAFETAIAVTSNNIANANTQGYAVETADLTSAIPQNTGESAIGNGVDSCCRAWLSAERLVCVGNSTARRCSMLNRVSALAWRRAGAKARIVLGPRRASLARRFGSDATTRSWLGWLDQGARFASAA